MIHHLQVSIVTYTPENLLAPSKMRLLCRNTYEIHEKYCEHGKGNSYVQ